MADAAVLELFGEMPGPEVAAGRVGGAQEGLGRAEEELGADEARALEALAVGEIPGEGLLAQEAIEVGLDLGLEGLEARVVAVERFVVARVEAVVVRLLMVEDVDVADQVRMRGSDRAARGRASGP